MSNEVPRLVTRWREAVEALRELPGGQIYVDPKRAEQVIAVLNAAR
jgi:hypothetical protein